MWDARLMLFVMLLPFLGSIITAFLPTRARNVAAILAGAICLSGLAVVLWLYGAVVDGGVRGTVSWLPALGLEPGLRLTGLSWLFSVLILGIGALIMLYARYYMSAEDPVPRFFSFLLAFMGSMLGIVLSSNLIQLAFFWEMTSIFSFLLIGYWHHNQSARDGARMSLVVTAAGGMCLLVGFLLLGHIAGSYDLDEILASGDAVRSSNLYLPTLIFILLGAFTKSAQFPFHFWLPRAMAAPTPVSAYLHSATMVKAGVFLLALLWPVLSGTPQWFYIVGTVGLSTLLLGALAAIFQQDLKGLLAYSTISHLGLITLLLGMGTPLAAVAAIFHMANHATFKASLFMAAGVIDHETGTRDLRRLSGLRNVMPITATLAMVAAAAMAGVPLLNGFLSKEMFLAETLETQGETTLGLLLPYLATLASAFTVLYSLRFIHQTFFGPPPKDLPRMPHEPPRWLLRPIAVLVLACLLVGMIPGLTIGPFLATAVRSVLGDATPVYSLAVWHGVNTPMLMSLTALTGGTLLYLVFVRRLNAMDSLPVIGRIKAHRQFEIFMDALGAGARAIRVIFGTGKLQPQLRLLICMALLAVMGPVLLLGYRAGDAALTPSDPAFAIIWLLGGGSALAAAWQAKYQRLAALILMGIAGLATCVSFVWLSAPDLAVTQLLVEIVTLILLLLGLRWLPKRRVELWTGDMPLSVLLRRGGDLVIAIGAGLGMSLLAYAMMTRPVPDSISRFFLENAYVLGGGTNVVNVILVDFRAFDTLGEITVLCIAALSVFSLLRRFRPAPDSMREPLQQQAQTAFDATREGVKLDDTPTSYLMVPRIIMEWLAPVIITLAVYLLLRGHDQPGGGFAAGVTMSIAIIVQYMASGTRQTETRWNIRPLSWIAFGLLCAAATSMGAAIWGKPFLSSYFQYLDIPWIGKVPVASALLFDVGVFFLVIGATGLVLIALAHQSIRKPSRLAETPEEE